MGANAQTSVPAFTAGQVLTAQQQTEINTGVPVFATTTTRDAAFGGTGEKVLAQGQLAYIEATNVVQYYNGTSWATLAPASSGALTLISATTIGTSVASTTVSGAFSSTYDNYLITLSGGALASLAAITLQLGATTTGYYAGYVTSTPAAVVGGAGDNNGANFSLAALGDAGGLNGVIQLQSPNLAKNTFMHTLATAQRTSGAVMYHGSGWVNNTTQYTAFTLGYGANATGGTICVYGYANS